MLDQLAQVDMSIYFQTIMFIVFIALVIRLHWKMGSIPHMMVSGAKYLIFVFIFIYLFLNWASDVNPTLRSSSILIMTLINIYMLWQTIVAFTELPYRRALSGCVDGACTADDLEQAFSTGKRFYKVRYFFAALTCGGSPFHFLAAVAAERTRDDLHRVFTGLDPKASVFGASLYFQFLRSALAADKSMPGDKRSERQRAVEALARDPWLTEKTSDFLHHLLASPEELLDAGLKESLRSEGKMI